MIASVVVAGSTALRTKQAGGKAHSSCTLPLPSSLSYRGPEILLGHVWDWSTDGFLLLYHRNITATHADMSCKRRCMPVSQTWIEKPADRVL